MYMLSVGCLLLLIMVFATLTATLRLFPPLGNCLRFLLVASLIVSVRFDYLLLTRVAAPIKRWLNIDVLEGLWRVTATIILSLAIGSLLLWLMGWGLGGWGVLVLTAHGLLAGLVWDEVIDDASLQLGVKL